MQEGILTVVVSGAAYFFIVNYPGTAKFLTEEERAYIYDRLSQDSDATRDEAFAWKNVSKAFKDPKVWLYGLGFHTMSLPLYTLSLFLVSVSKCWLVTKLRSASSLSSRQSYSNWGIQLRRPNF